METIFGWNSQTDTLFVVQHIGEEVVALLAEDSYLHPVIYFFARIEVL